MVSVIRIRAALPTLVACMVASAAPLSAQAPSPDSLRALLTARVALGRNPGLVAAVITREGTVSAVAGRADSPDRAPLSPTTIFEIGSITKAVTGTLFADALARGEVREDERLLDVLPDVPLPDSARGITLLDLATHRSGLAGFPVGYAPPNAAEPWAGVTREVLYASLARPGALRFAPGARAEYSNVGAGLLGQALVVRAQGRNPKIRDFAALVRERFAAPLGLRDFVLTLSPAQEARFAQGHAAGEPTAHWSLDYLAGAGAIRAPLTEMITVARACLGQAPAPLAAAIAEAQRPRRAFTRDSIGLHWIVVPRPTGAIVWHNGGTGGFRSWLGCNRATGRAAVVLTNGDAGADDIGMHLVDPALPLRPPAPLRKRTIVAVDTTVMQGLVGVYRLAPTFALTVTRDGNRLFAQATGQDRFELFAESPTSWFLKVVEASLEFERVGDGPATAAVLVQGGARQRAARESVAASPGTAQPSSPDYAAGMHAAHGAETPAASPAARIQPRTPVTSEAVTYGMLDGKALKGVLARPTGGKPGPALIVIHEWWGLNDNIKAVAARYAGEGYTVLAVDLFGTVASTPDAAMKLYQAAMRNAPAGERNVAAAIAYLKQAGATSIGAVGYCFGGHWSLRTGLVGGADVKAVAIYYGAPITDAAALARLKAPVIGFYGALDTGIPVDSVRTMQSALTSSGRTMSMQVYEGANHAFANPSGQAYNAKAAEDAWAKALAFFRANLR